MRCTAELLAKTITYTRLNPNLNWSRHNDTASVAQSAYGVDSFALVEPDSCLWMTTKDKSMHSNLLEIFMVLPTLTLNFSFVVNFVTLMLLTKPISYITYGFLMFEVYVNWIAVILAQDSQNASDDTSGKSVSTKRVWYCPKCNTYTSLSCHHCILCNKCVVQRDHHCFFLGACICLRNLCHFIAFCLYTSITSFYVNVHIYLHLYQHFHNQEVASLPTWHLGARYFFPVALGKWILGQEEFLYLGLVALFNLLVSLAIFTFGFGIYNLYGLVNGEAVERMSGRLHQPKKTNIWDNFHSVFGKWGLLNFIFPFALMKHC